ncbi:ribosomal protein S18 acetylase RimI-like enzyme [Arthrobacter stackebrandtii]|uniref:Ribosomal protein S18 acetylase RimI-like enzyme n=1 Tax=Arthrobacter stackebrandtii TaxID=272161 RepID=A0ABS4Z0A7_9MICC|nr:GNAT family N-acetyltransferase [Arthrobacter stackebrandtii]MBP2414389.1 ribosomal protein S18 acetylase RimI-like enzyme [Arthrobacter stackebrandtii]PYH01526.1 GNAT family N-acetyltransferase [Arthrobacter stackebrandtii]
MLKPAAPSLDLLESLMAAAWPALESSTADGWVLRSAGGVTQRANSVWPAEPASDELAALRSAENWYAGRRQPVIFQLTRREENAPLEALLDTQGYSQQSETIVMTSPVPPAAPVPGAAAPEGAAIRVEVAGTPSEEWLELWWRVDGRGGAAEKQTARRILLGASSLYATARSSEGVAVGTGRLTLVDGWAGVYGMATHPDFRRQGVASAVLAELLGQAFAADVAGLWLMVTAANAGAQALYEHAGFAEAARYHYRQAPLRRAFGAC